MSEVKKDCFAYIEAKNECSALNELICSCKKCTFYKHKSEVDFRQIEQAIKHHAISK